VDFNITDQQLIRYSTFIRYWIRNGIVMGQYFSYFIDFEKAYDSVWRGVVQYSY